MKLKPLLVAAVGMSLAATVVVGVTPASGAQPPWYFAEVGGTQVRVAGTTVTSDQTAPTEISGSTYPNSQSGNVADASVPGLLDLGAVTASDQATQDASGTKVVGVAQTAGVNLLNGLVKIDALTTTTTASLTGGNITVGSTTTIAGISVVGVNIPVSVPQNFTATIPGVARLILNGVITGDINGGKQVIGFGLDVTLLEQVGSYPSGTEITINPSNVALDTGPVPTAPSVLAGVAYGSSISVTVPGVAAVNSGPTAEVIMARGGTLGTTAYNRTAGVSVPSILTAGAVVGSQSGVAATSGSNVTEAYQTAGINLLNGAITADAISGSATVVQNAKGKYTASVTTTFVNLKIAGVTIPLTVHPNTVIKIAGLATVAINTQVKNKNYASASGLTVTLTVAKFGLPVGAVIHVGVAAAGINLTY